MHVAAHLKFYILLLGLITLESFLAIYFYSIITVQADLNLNMITWFVVNQLAPLSLLGIGLGLPVVLLTILFGWLQLLLIMKGIVAPHLSSKGFLEALFALLTRKFT